MFKFIIKITTHFKSRPQQTLTLFIFQLTSVIWHILWYSTGQRQNWQIIIMHFYNACDIHSKIKSRDLKDNQYQLICTDTIESEHN